MPCVCSIKDHRWRQNVVRTKNGTRGAATTVCHCSYHIKLKGTEFPVVHFKITTQSWRYTVCAIFKSRKIFYFLVTIKVSPRRLWFLRALSINIINVNESDPRSNEHYLGSSENKALKNFRPVQDLNLFSLLSFSLLLK